MIGISFLKLEKLVVLLPSLELGITRINLAIIMVPIGEMIEELESILLPIMLVVLEEEELISVDFLVDKVVKVDLEDKVD